MRKTGKILVWIVVFGLLAGLALAAQESEAVESSEEPIGRTPPRLSLVEGEVSFWRPGAEEWVQAQINTPLAPGDQLFAGPDSRMEIQIGAKAFVRGGPDTQIGLESQEPDFLQLRVIAGQASLDVRTIDPGRMVEVDTPNAAFTIATEGYYRVDVGAERTTFITRRAGRATAISANGDKTPIGPNQAVTIEGVTNPSMASQTAPPLDSLDQWNYARTDWLLDQQESARYVSPEAYGTSDLDRYGTWRVVPTYGAVWTPRGVGADWVPYSTGVWMHDPYYGWTWVDTAPWGWAPYHYGRWIRFSGYWGWAPGPRIRPVYAPALVAFFGAPGFQASIGFSGPVVGWVSLGWGEPLIPWWGSPGFIHRPWWGGWAGPRFVNNRVVRHTHAIRATEISIYRNTRVRNAMVVVGRDRFGRGPITHERIRPSANHQLHPTFAAPGITATSASLVPTTHRGTRPPETYLRRNVISAGGRRGEPTPAAGFNRGDNNRQTPRNTAQGQGTVARPDTATRMRTNGRSAPAPAVQEGGHGTQRRRDLAPPANRPAADPQRPAAEVKREDSGRFDRKAAPAREGSLRTQPSAPQSGPRVESDSRVERAPAQRPSGTAPAIQSGPQRRRDPAPPANRPAADPQRPARTDRLSGPRSAGRPAAEVTREGSGRSEFKAPPVTDGGMRPQRSAPQGGPRVESGSRVERVPEQRLSGPSPAIRSGPQVQPQREAPSGSFAPRSGSSRPSQGSDRGSPRGR